MSEPLEGLNRRLLDPEEWLRQQDQRIAALKAASEEATRELKSAQIERTDRDHVITVTVNPSGILMSAVFSSRAQNYSPAQLSAKLMQTYGEAARAASAKMLDIMTGVVGEDTQALNFMKEYMPDPEEDDPDGGSGAGYNRDGGYYR